MENTPAPATSNFLDWVEIKNFKSIKDLRLDCKRVNIFIGKPNVGKSNILEALGILGAEYYDGKFMNGGVRYKNVKHLFYQNDSLQKILVKTRKFRVILGKPDKIDNYFYVLNKNYSSILEENLNSDMKLFLISAGESIQINNIGDKIEGILDKYVPLRKYDYSGVNEFLESNNLFLLPNGNNLFDVIDRSHDLKNEFGKLFSEQGLDLVLDKDNQSFSLQRKDGFYVYRFDYYTIADTFRRFMFYIAAIESNENSVIVFEEPEVHSFPPYTQDVAYRMIYSETNQFFVSTHSPYLLQTLVENLNDEQVAVFVTYYENYETKVKQLSPEELSFVQEYSTDVFFNLDRFIPTSDAASVS